MDEGYLQWMIHNFPNASPWQRAASDAFAVKQQEAVYPFRSLLADLKTCGTTRDLAWGRRIHAAAVQTGDASNIRVRTALIRMYAKCGRTGDARHVFDSIQFPDVVCWNVLLLGYAENGEGHIAVDLFSRMATAPNALTYVAVFKACASLGASNGLKVGRHIHSEMTCCLNLYVHNTLIDMYAKCGSMADARGVFDMIQKPDVVSWNALLFGYVENGEGRVALELFSRMKSLECATDSVTYLAVLGACASLSRNEDGGRMHGLQMGKRVHSEIAPRHLNHYVQNALIDMYAKCGSMRDARAVFDNMRKPSIVSWNALLLGYAVNGEGSVALELFSKLKTHGYEPSTITYVAVLTACTSLALNGDAAERALGLEIGRSVHSQIGCSSDVHLQSSLINMYAKHSSMAEARRVFDSISNPDVVSWSALLLGYAENGEGYVALDLFQNMKTEPNCVLYVAVLKACGSLAANGDDRGKAHSLKNTLIDMYAKCGRMPEAHAVFDQIRKPDVVSWNALLMGYAENGEGQIALDAFSTMKTRECLPDSVTYVAVVMACTSLLLSGSKAQVLDTGRQVHSEIGCLSNFYVQSTLITMYAKCCSMLEACQVFRSMRNPDVVAWNALILGYAENGEGHAAVELFFEMKTTGCVPDCMTYVAIISACGSIGALELGRRFHSEIREFTVHLVTCLVDFYAKCASMLEAREVFDLHSTRRCTSTWNALLSGYGTSADTVSVFALFDAMQDEGFRPDAVTFLCMLLCCSHAGLVEKLKELLQAMAVHGLAPGIMHYTCAVDTMGRANQLNEAIAVLQKMHCNPDPVIWMALLSACNKWKNVEVGSCAFQSLLYMHRNNGPAYVLMAQIYGSRGMWEHQEMVLQGRTLLHTKKQYSSSHSVEGGVEVERFNLWNGAAPEQISAPTVAHPTYPDCHICGP